MNTNFDKEDYKTLKQTANAKARRVTEQDWASAYNGVAVAFRPMSNQPDCRMLAVAVSYCAMEDTFKKKVGKYQALLKLEMGEYVQLPLAEYYNDCGPDEIAEVLLGMFSTV